MSPLLLALLAADPPSSAYLQIRNQGADAGAARILNCTGAYVSCAVDSHTGLATLSVPPFDAGTFSGIGACASHKWASTLSQGVAPTCTQPAQIDLSGTHKLVSSNATNATVTPATTGLSWSVAAVTEYGFYCVLTSSGTATSLATFNLNGPNSSTVSFSTSRYTTTSAQTSLVLQSFSSSAQTAACTTSCVTTQLPTYAFGTILTGDAGTVDLQFASSTAGQTVTVYRGSYCEVF